MEKLYIIVGLFFCVCDIPGGYATAVDSAVHPVANQRAKRAANDVYSCHLRPKRNEEEESVFHRIKTQLDSGIKLIEMNLFIDGYNDTDPLNDGMTHNYHSNKWHLAFDTHGQTLLTLAFNYDVLSLLMLTFGTGEMDVTLQEYPDEGCFEKLSEDEKTELLKNLTTSYFRVGNMSGKKEKIPGTEDTYFCHQLIEGSGGAGHFQFECCRRDADGVITCMRDAASVWIMIIYTLISAVKIFFFLFGPVYLIGLVHSESFRVTDYVIKLKEPLLKTLLVKKLKAQEPAGQPARLRRQFRTFRRNVKEIPADQVQHVSFSKLHVTVDQRRLMSEKSVPVGLFSFLYQTVCLCKIAQWDQFRSCCEQSIFGSWSPYFLWFRLKRDSECNRRWRGRLSWGHVATGLGALLMVAALPFPYYIRLVIYYYFESSEVAARHTLLHDMGLDHAHSHNLLQMATPTHPVMILLYLLYLVTSVALGVFRYIDSARFNEIVVTAVQDLRHISRPECLNMLIAHLILPFEKFGLFAGSLVALVYWPIAIPICLIVGVVYCVPTLYLAGRFLIHKRPTLFQQFPYPAPPRDNIHSLTDGASSLESALLLENISPDNDLDALVTRNVRPTCTPQRLYAVVSAHVVGVLCILLMLSILVLYAEVFGFLVEVFVFTMMGAIVNASIAARYVMLAFWIIMYTCACFNHVYAQYLDLSASVFNNIKSRLGEDVRQVTLLREEKQHNTAFKYFSRQQLLEKVEEEAAVEEMYESDDIDTDDEIDEDTVARIREARRTLPIDDVKYMDGKLNWQLNSLVFFVDNKDVPRIPKELFYKICNIRAPGCPGPVGQALIKATHQLLYMILFLVFVLVVVMAFGNIYNISTTNQLMVTLAGGFVPFVVRFVIQPKKANISLGTYSFEGKIHSIIKNYSQLWPIFDLSFKIAEPSDDDASDETKPNNGHGPHSPVSTDGIVLTEPRAAPTHVDLLITVRDDPWGSSSPKSTNSPHEEGTLIQKKARKRAEDVPVTQPRTGDRTHGVDLMVDLALGSVIAQTMLDDSTRDEEQGGEGEEAV